MASQIQSDVVVRVWEPDLLREGARLSATTTRRDVTFRTRQENLFDVEDVTMPGLVVITESGKPGPDKAGDVVVRAIPDQIRFTILSTEELIWLPVAATRDVLGNWHIETVPYVEWLRIVLRNEPKVKQQ